MSTVRFRLMTKKRNGAEVSNLPASIYVRYTSGREIQLECKTPLMVLPKDWNQKTQKVKMTLTSAKSYEAINLKLVQLTAGILNEANIRIIEGQPRDKFFLQNAVDDVFKMPRRTETRAEQMVVVKEHITYLSSFAQWWIDNKQDTYLTKSNKPLSKSSKDAQGWAMRKIALFEAAKRKKLRFANFNESTQNQFISFFLDQQGLKQSSLNIIIKEVKFLVQNARKEGAQVHNDFPAKAFIAKRREDRKEAPPVLSLEEIEMIYNHDFSYNQELEAYRDYFIIGLNTGMRISDFYLTMGDEHIHNGEIFKKAVKNDVQFKAPIFDQVRSVLDKWNGLPPKQDEKNMGNMRNKFNKAIRDICRIVGINDEVMAEHWDSDQKRRVYGKCQKWETITSHICRRSFATNMDKLGVKGEDIDAICGWKTPTMRLKYTKTTLSERADRAKEVYNNRENSAA